MRQGDIVVNLEGKLIVEFNGWIRGLVCSFKINTENGFEKFSGTYEELLLHCYEKVKAHNEHVEKFGGFYL